MAKIKSIVAIWLCRTLGCLSLASARGLGRHLGTLAYRLNIRMTKVTRANLTVCLPQLSEADREKLVLHSLQETAKVALEICVIWRTSDQPIQRLIKKRQGEELALDALEQGKGLIILAPHLGNWEVLGLHLSSLGAVTNLYQPPKLEGLEAMVRKSREASGSRLVPTNAKGVAALLKALKTGGISGILPDQNPQDTRSGEFVPFFGQPALTMVLVHKLIQRTGCKVLFAFAKRIDEGFELIYRLPPEEVYADDQTTALTALNRGVETLVVEAPEQYQWEYKRFKKTPANKSNPLYQNT